MGDVQISGWGIFAIGVCSGLGLAIFVMLVGGYLDNNDMAELAEKRRPVYVNGRPHYLIPWNETTARMRGEKKAISTPDFREYPPKDQSHHDYDLRGNPLRPGS